MGEAMGFFDPPPALYFGGKWQLADWIIAQMPPHTVYIEPYCGGASVFFRKEPAPLEILNDLNGDVLNFFDMLRTRTDDLVRAIDFTPYSRAEFERSFEPCEDTLEQARRFYIRCYQAFGNGGVARKTGWRHAMNEKSYSTPVSTWSRLSGLFLGARRLKQAQLECQDALAVITHYDQPGALFYVDPPYVFQSRNRATNRYLHEMTDDQHRELATLLHQVEGMVLLSGYQSPLYDELYGDWTVLSKTSTTNGNSTSTEFLWLSPNAVALNRLPLFSQPQVT